MGSIQNLISQKKEKEANEYLVNFAKLLRMVLSNSEKKLVPLSDEIQLLDLYLQLEQLRVLFTYTINFIKTDGGYILMKDGTNITISRQRREMVIQMLRENK